MKILHVIDSMDLYRGGPTVCVASIAAAQAAQGHEVKVLSYQLEDPEKFNEFQVKNIPNYELVVYVHIKPVGLKSALRSYVDESDVVHIHGMWQPILYYAAVLAHITSTSYVVTPHGMLDPWSLSQKKLKKKIALFFGWKKVLNKAKFIHALNEDEKRLLVPMSLTSQINVVPNGIFDEVFSEIPDESLFLSNYGGLRDKRLILFLSRLHYKKGLDYLVSSYATYINNNPDTSIDVDLVIAGPDDGAQDQLMQMIQESGLHERIHVIGPLYNDYKYSAYQAACCFCLPSRQEGFSIAITEAMACGLPVVISKPCNFNEVATANAGYVVDLDINEIADALSRVLEDNNNAVRMGSNGKNLIFTKYTWNSISKKLLELY